MDKSLCAASTGRRMQVVRLSSANREDERRDARMVTRASEMYPTESHPVRQATSGCWGPAESPSPWTAERGSGSKAISPVLLHRACGAREHGRTGLRHCFSRGALGFIIERE